MIDKNVIIKIASHCDVEVESFVEFDLSRLGIKFSDIHGSVSDYFSVIPNTPIHADSFSSRDLCRLCGQNDLREQNHEYIPGCQILTSGFVTFGTDPCGDAFAVSVHDGKVYLVSHEISWDEEIHNDESRSSENHRIIAESSDLVADSISDFLYIWLGRLDEIDVEEREFRDAAASDPNAKDGNGNTQLIYAVRDGAIVDVRRQLDAGADIEYFGKTENRNALGESVVFGHTEILKLLIEFGADVNATNEHGETALMLGAHYSKRDCIELLLRAGADRALRDHYDRKAYDRICVVHGTPEIAAMLRERE
jgi:hypothetical protein